MTAPDPLTIIEEHPNYWIVSAPSGNCEGAFAYPNADDKNGEWALIVEKG